MRVILDACVLYPTVLREMLLGAAAAGAFVPLWSGRILQEWQGVAARNGHEAMARVEIALVADRWQGAGVAVPEGADAGLVLPDPGDIHVLAAALAGQADAILTLNARDFPGPMLARHGLIRRAPDEFLHEWALAEPGAAARVAGAVQARAAAAAGAPQPLRPLLKRAGLPRLARRLAGPGA
jgi:predicted nucleic acid-binding protein